MPVVRTLRRALGPLFTLALFLAIALVACSASRLGLVLMHLDRVRAVEGSWWLFPIGVRLDLMALCPAAFFPAAVLLLYPRTAERFVEPLVAVYLTLVALVMVFLEAATGPFLTEYDSRPNRIFIDYLAYPHELAGTLWADHKTALVAALLLLAATARVALPLTRGSLRAEAPWSWPRRLAALPLVAGLLFLGARSTAGHRGANVSTAAFSTDHLTNELALDSTYAVAYAVYTWREETDPQRLYGHLRQADAIARVRRQMLLPPDAFSHPDLPLLHRETSRHPQAQPYNLVIVLEESLGAEYVGSLGGLPLTPNLDALARDGLFLTNLYATGTRTVRGIEATVTGLLPTPGDSVVKRGLAQGDFFTIADLLRRQGYATDFVYGGMSNFDNMRGFFLGNGFERVLDERSFADPTFRGTWGVSDEDLVRRANAAFVAHGEQPFFALLLSTSNHEPYEYPPGRISPYERPANTAHNAVKYADWAIGELFRLARQEDYFRRTVFLVVADHDKRVWGADLVPIEKFHIPGLVIGPGIAPRRHEGLASQVDLLPTLVDALGLDVEHPMISRDLFAVPDGVPGHAFMQYDMTHAYRVGDAVVIHQPFAPPRQFTYRDGRLVPMALDPELAADALAHVQVPATLYQERRYRLPGAAPVAAGPPTSG